MEEQKLYNLFIKKSNWKLHIIYWLTAAFLMYFIFSNRNYDVQIRLVLVSILIVVSYFVTLIVNNFLIPKYLFAGRLFIFVYVSIAVFIITLSYEFVTSISTPSQSKTIASTSFSEMVLST